MKPLALDLFCGGGGACEGLQRAGFDVVGVDIVAKHAKHYPGHFVHGDACTPPVNLSDFAMVWASPAVPGVQPGNTRRKQGWPCRPDWTYQKPTIRTSV